MSRKGGESSERVSPSGIPVKAAYAPADAAVDYNKDLGEPGEFPFTRGVQATMYRGRLWTMSTGFPVEPHATMTLRPRGPMPAPVISR